MPFTLTRQLRHCFGAIKNIASDAKATLESTTHDAIDFDALEDELDRIIDDATRAKRLIAEMADSTTPEAR